MRRPVARPCASRQRPRTRRAHSCPARGELTRRGDAGSSSPRRLGLRGIRDRHRAARCVQDRPSVPLERRSPVRLRGSDRGRRGGQHGASDRGVDRAPWLVSVGSGLRRCWALLPPAPRVVAIDLRRRSWRLPSSSARPTVLRPMPMLWTRSASDRAASIIALEIAGSVKALELAYRITRRGGRR